MKLDVAVSLPREGESVGLIRQVATSALGTFGVTQECIEDIRLALSEACTNVIDHAAADDEYEVRFQVDERRCAISVRNTGGCFDAATLANAMPDASSARGRGVAIMRALMDQVDFNSEPERGTIVKLVKTLTVPAEGPWARLHRRPTGT